MNSRKIYASMMTYNVSDEEKERATKCIRWFNYCSKLLEQCNDHLNLMYNPFKDGEAVSPDEIFRIRASLRGYRDKVIENFNAFKKAAFKCYVVIQPFMSDTQTDKLIKSFIDSVENIEIQVNRFADLFSNLKSEDFIKGVVAGIENIKKECAKLQQNINERIKTHMQTNILARSWVDTVSDELQEKVERKSPLIMQMVEDRNKGYRKQ